MPDETKDAGRGMGLTDRQLLWRVEVPLALPEIMAGLRIAVTTTVGLATLAFFAGAGRPRRADLRRHHLQVERGRGRRAGGAARGACSTARSCSSARDHALDAGGGGAMNDFVDAIEFIFNEHESPAGGRRSAASASMWELMWEHLKLAVAAMAIACALSIPLGPVARAHRQGRLPGDQRLERGPRGAEPRADRLLRGLHRRGLHEPHARARAARHPADPHQRLHRRAQVDRDTVDSARGMGMTGAQIVRRVELPLALPLIFGGIRISAVNVVATATIAPLAGVVTLGDPIINVNTYGDEGRLAAAIVVALLAVATEVVLGAVQRAVTPRGLKLEGGRHRWRRLASHAQQQKGSLDMRRHRWLMLLALLVAALAVAGCGDDDDDDGGGGGGADTSGAVVVADPEERQELVDQDHDRLEELHRAEGARRDLRAGAERGRLRRLDRAEPRRREDGAQGARGRRHQRLPGVHRNRAAVVLRRTGRQAAERRGPRPTRTAKEGFAKKDLTALPPTPFVSSNEVASRRRPPTSSA